MRNPCYQCAGPHAGPRTPGYSPECFHHVTRRPRLPLAVAGLPIVRVLFGSNPPSAYHVTDFEYLFLDAAHELRGIAKPIPSGPPYRDSARRVDADQIALSVDEAPPMRVLMSVIVLNEILERSRPSLLAAVALTIPP